MTMEERKTAKLSDYIPHIRNGKYLSPERVQKMIDQNTSGQKDSLFAKVFPLPNYYGVVTGEGEFEITTYEGRSGGTEAKKKNSEMNTFREYFILDVEAFESFLDAHADEVSLKRLPRGFKPLKPSATGFASAEYLSSLSPEEAAKYAASLAEAKLSRPKREMTDEHKAKIKAALDKARSAKGGSKSTKKK